MRSSDLKAMILASVIAMLVWIYAEGQSLVTRSFNVPIAIESDAASGLVVEVADPEFRRVGRVRLEGTARTIDDAADQLKGTIRLAPGMPGVPNQPGESRTVDLLQAVSALPELKGLGSSVADVEPRTVLVRVIRVVAREVTVQVEVPSEVALDGDPQATPSQVVLQLPEATAALLPEALVAVAIVPEIELARLANDGPKVVTAKVRVPPALEGIAGVSVAPDTVSVLLRPRRVVETARLSSVPIWFSLPPTEDTGRWSIEMLDKFLTDVTISGTAEAVRRVRDGQAIVRAVIELGSDDLQRSVTTKPVRFTGLPQGVTATAANPEARVRITRRPDPAAGSPGPSAPASAP